MKLFTVGVPNSIGVFLVAAPNAQRAKKLICDQSWRTAEQILLIQAAVVTSLELEVESTERLVAVTHYSDTRICNSKSTSSEPASKDETREPSSLPPAP